jgi:hypothetical protein
MPSIINFKSVQSIDLALTLDQSLMNRPASSRFAHTQNPDRSKYNTFICVARLLIKTYKPPSLGSASSLLRTNADRPSKLRRMSHGAPYR